MQLTFFYPEIWSCWLKALCSRKSQRSSLKSKVRWQNSTFSRLKNALWVSNSPLFYVFLTMLTFWVAFQGGRHFYKEPHYLKSSVIPCYWPWHGGAGRLVQQLYYCWRKPLEAMALCSWSCTYHVISFGKFFWLTLILFWNKIEHWRFGEIFLEQTVNICFVVFCRSQRFLR